PPAGTVPAIRWIGAGWNDYPWLFATDGEYTAFAAVAAGQFDAVKDHLRALRAVSEIVNAGSGKVVHEVTPDGQVYFGTNTDPGTAPWAHTQATKREQRFEQAWWYGGDANGYADSLADPNDVQLFQRHWIGVTPMEASLPAGRLADPAHAQLALAQRERDCYT